MQALKCMTQAVDTDEGDIASQQGKRRAAPDEAEEGLSETEGMQSLEPHTAATHVVALIA